MKAWARARIIPIIATAALVVVGVNVGVEWYPIHGVSAFAGGVDVWRSYIVTDQMLHGHFAQVYSRSSGLIGLPGSLWVLAPGVVVSQLLHLSIGTPVTFIRAPTAWFALEPWIFVLSGPLLFAVDSLARRLSVATSRRWWLAGLEVVVLWNVAFWYGHPEYPLAVALVLFAVPAAIEERWARCGWLFGVAIALQPIALPAAAVAFAFAPARRWPGLAGRMVLPAVVVLAGPLLANWQQAWQTLRQQPASLTRDHVTPWVHLAPHLPGPWISAAPMRSAGTLAAFAICLMLCRHRPPLLVVLAAVAGALTVRCVVDPVVVSYYLFAPLAVILVVASRAGRVRFAVVGALAVAVTAYAKAGPGGEWRWPLIVVGGTLVALAVAWPFESASEPASIPGEAAKEGPVENAESIGAP